MDVVCESCEALPAEVEEACDDGPPYRVCAECHSRLMAHALRPREWFNLAKVHGWWQYLLGDDFYDDNGTAHQPEIDVERPDDHPSPTLVEVQDDCDQLLDYTITRWQFSSDVAAAWQTLDPSDVLRTLERRYATACDVDILGVTLDVAACSLGELGRDFVSAAWDIFREPWQLGSLAQASASCLQFNDGFSRVVTAFTGMDEKSRRDRMYALSYFHCRETLDWIESNVVSPVTGDWGRLAAASGFDWERTVSWLTSGRPLSLVALDTLQAIVRPQTPLLRDHRPELQTKPDLTTFKDALNEYLDRDSAPRVKMIVQFLMEHSDSLTAR